MQFIVGLGMHQIETVQKTVEVPQLPSRIGSCSSWTRLRRPLLYNNRCLGYDSVENCGDSAVADRLLFGPGRRHLCRVAETISHGPFRKP